MIFASDNAFRSNSLYKNVEPHKGFDVFCYPSYGLSTIDVVRVKGH